MRPHELNRKELSQVIVLTKKILREAKNRGLDMSKRKAHKLAVKHLGFVDKKDYEMLQKEKGTDNRFLEGVKTALPKYRNL